MVDISTSCDNSTDISAGDVLIAEGRRPGGPTTGAAMSRVRVVEVTNRFEADLLGQLDFVVASAPAASFDSAHGAGTLAGWYARTSPHRVLHAYAPDGELAGHAALRLNGRRPDGALLPRPWSWEIALVAVRPGYRGCGIGARLVSELTAGLSAGVAWASVPATATAFAAAVGWSSVAEHTFAWPDETAGQVWLPPAR